TPSAHPPGSDRTDRLHGATLPVGIGAEIYPRGYSDVEPLDRNRQLVDQVRRAARFNRKPAQERTRLSYRRIGHPGLAGAVSTLAGALEIHRTGRVPITRRKVDEHQISVGILGDTDCYGAGVGGHHLTDITRLRL